MLYYVINKKELDLLKDPEELRTFALYFCDEQSPFWKNNSLKNTLKNKKREWRPIVLSTLCSILTCSSPTEPIGQAIFLKQEHYSQLLKTFGFENLTNLNFHFEPYIKKATNTIKSTLNYIDILDHYKKGIVMPESSPYFRLSEQEIKDYIETGNLNLEDKILAGNTYLNFDALYEAIPSMNEELPGINLKPFVFELIHRRVNWFAINPHLITFWYIVYMQRKQDFHLSFTTPNQINKINSTNE